MDTKSSSVREWRGAPKMGAWHWVVALLEWCSGRRGLYCRRAGLAAEVIACWECPSLAILTFAYEAVARCPPGAVARSPVGRLFICYEPASCDAGLEL
ncbi:hypothetical protein CDL15_Pgr017340 [Punica granatum]|uniref:Uncharacterized protein n=1 Tax=Punica granatum TaxID=22663 RepID=A0A218Y4G7_PUNGR|nr:hypothetical protein CDL15_Pgr017340 [Punica granatum]